MTFDEIGKLANRVRNIPLAQVLEESGAVRDKSDKDRWRTPRGAISVTGTKFMNWHRACGGGGAIDLVMHLHQLGFKAAVLWLRDRFPVANEPPLRGGPSRQHFTAPPRDDVKLPRVLRYLTGKRRLPRSLLDPLLGAGTLYADTRANAVFLLLGHDDEPVGAELRGTSPTIAWRGMAGGSRKADGYFSVRNVHAMDTIILCESAIDAISCAAMHDRCCCISTAGATPSPTWLAALTECSNDLYCGFDADQVGDQMAQQMTALHPRIKRHRPWHKDWNEALVAARNVATNLPL